MNNRAIPEVREGYGRGIDYLDCYRSEYGRIG